MAKKTKAQNQSELDKELQDDEKEAEATAKEVEQAQKQDLAKKANEEPMITMHLPRLDSGKPVVIKINNKQYSGQVTVPESMALQLREMADKIVERERSIHVGRKFQGNGSGIGGMRRVGSV